MGTPARGDATLSTAPPTVSPECSPPLVRIRPVTGSLEPSRGRQSRWGPAVPETYGAVPRKIGFRGVMTAAPSRDPATPQPWHRASPRASQPPLCSTWKRWGVIPISW